MKTLQKFTILLALPVLYFLVISAFKPNEPVKIAGVTKESSVLLPSPPASQIPKDFTHFILNYGYKDYPTNWEIFNFWDYYRDSLSYNGVQLYHYGDSLTGHFIPDLTPAQISRVNGLINTSLSRNLKPIFQRAKIFRLCENAQRMVYEVEGNNDGYSYQSRYETPITDSGRTVVHPCPDCPPSSPNSPGWLCREISENRQHHFRHHLNYTPVLDWHLKPVMRIDSSVVDNFPEKPVVRIVVTNFKGDTIKSVIIKARNFANKNLTTGEYIYNGTYKNAYEFIEEPGGTDLIVSDGTGADGINYGYTPTNYNVSESKVDFKIYWLGEVEVWFDKMIVDNDYADQLFAPAPNNLDARMNQELDNFGEDMGMFFVDECITTNLPCVKYVQDHIRAYNQSNGTNIILSYATSNNLNHYFTKEASNRFKLYLDTAKAQVFQLDAHALQFNEDPNPGYIPANGLNDADIDSKVPESWKTNNNGTYNTYLQNCLGQKDGYVWPAEGSFIYQVNQSRLQIAQNSPNTRLTIQPQIQGWMVGNVLTGKFSYGCREPLNEEISAQAWIALAYGADNLCWFWLPSFEPFTDGFPIKNNFITGIPGDVSYCYGLFTEPDIPRRKNLYGQNKFDYLKGLNSKILSLKSALDAIEWNSAYSVHSEGADHMLIDDIKSIDPHKNGINGECYLDGLNWEDCLYHRFWEMGFYEPVGSAKYFVMVNRRCIPESVNPNYTYSGDDRVLKVKFDIAQLSASVNWQISEVGNISGKKKIFNRSGGYIDLGSASGNLGWFEPGEGKLFRLDPVFKSGGTLVADEDINGGSFECEDTIFNVGYNITISGNTSILFNDTSKIIVNGGSITIGDLETSNTITLGSITGNAWRGLELNNCEVRIYNTTFTGLANDTTYAINAIDCPVLDVRNCTFNINSNLKGGIKAVYYNEPEIDNIYIGGNTFNFAGSSLEAVNISGYAGMTTPLLVENNTISEGNIAILLSGITGGAVKNNALYGNNIGLSLLTSSVDVSGNTIYSEIDNAIGIFTAGGIARLNRSAALRLGGLNNISNTGTGTNNIKVENGYFIMDAGENLFNISDDQTSYHLSGYFPIDDIEIDATINCFKLGGSQTDPPINYVTWGEPVEFNFWPYLSNCSMNEQMNFVVFDLGNNIYDTIGTNEGEGGSHSSRYVIQSPKQMNDSLSILVRKRDYSNAKAKCLEMLNTYPDSILTLGAISKLFLSVSANDTSQAGMQELKNYYEGLILTNGNNAELVKRANYYIQKCKVRLHDYTSALSGFQQIINQNPYNFEGLQARWDFMATSLLMQGQGGGERGISDGGFGIANLKQSDKSYESYESDELWNDKSPYTKEQRQNIRKSINNAFEITKSTDEQMIKKLEDNSKSGDIKSQKQLNQKRALQQVIRTEKPKNIVEHMKIVQQDIHKVLGSEVKSKSGKESNIPLVFSLSQNYPNPFNPVTTIKYALPNDVKVIVKIYDILGREVKTLVNDFQKAGYYDAKFDGSNYASGVYFYRIEAGEFVQSKKMVLIK